jgi:hypothetical protein
MGCMPFSPPSAPEATCFPRSADRRPDPVCQHLDPVRQELDPVRQIPTLCAHDNLAQRVFKNQTLAPFFLSAHGRSFNAFVNDPILSP